jgi:DinB superfamily
VKWFDRKFDFTFPQEQLPNLIVRLQGTPARLEEMLRSASPAALLTKPEPEDKWSAQEHAGHLLDMESLWQARVEDFQVGRATLTAADLTNRKTDQAGHNARPLKDILSDFRTARAYLLNYVENLPPSAFESAILHPRLQQPMRLVDHLHFVAEHDDHHLAKIREMIGSRSVWASISKL